MMEDLHTSFQKGYDETPGSHGTSFHVLTHFQNTGHILSKHLSAEQTAYLEAWIEWVEPLVGEGTGRGDNRNRTIASSSTCIIKKRMSPKRVLPLSKAHNINNHRLRLGSGAGASA